MLYVFCVCEYVHTDMCVHPCVYVHAHTHVPQSDDIVYQSTKNSKWETLL